MNRSYNTTLVLAVLFLFFIQMGGILVESIYIIDLMNTRLDEKVLGVLFFFSPVLLYVIPKKFPKWLVWLLFAVLYLSRGLVPYLDTAGRLLASGLGTSAALLLLPLIVYAREKGESSHPKDLTAGAGLALGVGFSVLLRTVNYTLDYSTTPHGAWVGWGLGLLLGWLLTHVDWDNELPAQPATKGVSGALVGILLILNLVYFAFSAPGVIARWTEGNYAFIVLLVSLLSLGWVFLVFYKPFLIEQISNRTLVAWNVLFALSLVGTTLAYRVAFPTTPSTPPVFVGSPTWWQYIPLVLMLLLFPVLFADLGIFLNNLVNAQISPARMAPGLLLGALAFVLLIFMNIFTNVWGYVKPVSPFFRNKFWLPFLLSAGGVALLVILMSKYRHATIASERPRFIPWGWTGLAAMIFLVTAFGVWRTDRAQPVIEQPDSLIFMTYNIHQGNGNVPEKTYEQQLALIQNVNPDVIALQESDSARISINNNDFVRYYASKLGYYAYNGPTTVTGTYGTAILSRYPLTNTRTMFSFSNKDEIGTALAEIFVAGRQFYIYNVHPDGSDDAKRAFAQAVLSSAEGKSNVIVLGDHNLRDYEEGYQMLDAVFTNAWTSVYPSKISPDGIDMSGRNRIDHIFVSRDLGVRNPIYVLPPESGTDHPVHWAEVYWEK